MKTMIPSKMAVIKVKGGFPFFIFSGIDYKNLLFCDNIALINFYFDQSLSKANFFSQKRGEKAARHRLLRSWWWCRNVISHTGTRKNGSIRRCYLRVQTITHTREHTQTPASIPGFSPHARLLGFAGRLFSIEFIFLLVSMSSAQRERTRKRGGRK